MRKEGWVVVVVVVVGGGGGGGGVGGGGGGGVGGGRWIYISSSLIISNRCDIVRFSKKKCHVIVRDGFEQNMWLNNLYSPKNVAG